MKHKILILGPQGSGKGTQANILSEVLNIPALSMGQLLRNEIASGSDLGNEISSIINQGNLVSDDLALQILKKRLFQPDAENGYILDGYPRNKAQQEAYSTFDSPTEVLVIQVPRDESVSRLLKRAEIEGRADDTQELIEKRLNIYTEQTQPIIDMYKQQGVVKEVDGIGTIEEIAKRIKETIE
jgi:adenylate kinase